MFHSGLGLDNGSHLIGSLFVEKSAFKFPLPGRIGWKGVAGLGLARSLNIEHLAGEILHGALSLLLCFAPTRAAERVERGARLARSDIFADQERLAPRHIKFGRRLR